MTATLERASQTLSDDNVIYVEPAVTNPQDAVFENLYRQPYELLLTFPGGNITIRGKGEAPAWLEPTTRVLGQLLQLGPDWDSYGACEISPFSAEAAIKVLSYIMNDDTPLPAIVPTNKGNIQIEWHLTNIDLEIEVLSSSRLYVSYEDSNLDKEWEDEINSDWGLLRELVSRLL